MAVVLSAHCMSVESCKLPKKSGNKGTAQGKIAASHAGFDIVRVVMTGLVGETLDQPGQRKC